MKSVFFYKLNSSQLVVHLNSDKKEYIPVNVEHQGEFIKSLKESLISNNLYNPELDSVFNKLLEKEK